MQRFGPEPFTKGKPVNKTQLIDALSTRYEGNRKQAQHALESVLDTITREVARGEKVAITGFGSFEKRVREARWVRNPRTGDRMKAKKTAVPKFTAGADLKAVVSGAKKLPKLPKPAERAVSSARGSSAGKKAAEVAKKATGSGEEGGRGGAQPAKKAAGAAKKATSSGSVVDGEEGAGEEGVLDREEDQPTAKKSTSTAKKSTGSTAKKAVVDGEEGAGEEVEQQLRCQEGHARRRSRPAHGEEGIVDGQEVEQRRRPRRRRRRRSRSSSSSTAEEVEPAARRPRRRPAKKSTAKKTASSS